MASLPLIIVVSLSLILLHIIHASSNLLLLPVAKDPATHQFTTLIHHPPHLYLLQPIKLVVDLGSPSLWLHCSSPQHLNLIPRRSIQCTKANPDAGHLSHKTAACHVENRNDVSGLRSTGQLVEAPIAVRSIGGSTATVDRFLFSCGSTLMLNSLTSGALGMIGLGGIKSQISPTAQFAAAFGYRSRRFAVCLPNSDIGGVLAFGDSPVESVFGTEISRSLLYTPLVASSSSGGEYFINLKSIRIDGEKVSLNRDRIGLAKLSTTVPYTLMESWLYRIFTEAYLKAAAKVNMKRVLKAVSPFGLCFSRLANQSIPVIDLALQSEMVKWKVERKNSMVWVKGEEEEGEVMCLGILEGGSELEAAVVIGGVHMVDRVMEFDLDGSRLGFSSTMKQRTCSDIISHSSLPELSSSSY